MASTKNVLFLGTTGYIGGSILDVLLDHPKAAEFSVTAYFRTAEQAKTYEQIVGEKAIFGGLDVVEEAAAKADIIFNCASADDLPLTKAVLAGAKKRFASSKVPVVVVQTSGSGVYSDHAEGEYASQKLLEDTDSATINALPTTQWHRVVDTTIIGAHDEGYITSYTVYPGVIYGLATGRFVKAGLQRSVPTCELYIALEDLKRGSPGIVGAGKNRLTFVDIHDTVDLYILLFDAIISGKKIASGADGHYFAVNGPLEVGAYFRAVGQALFELGAIKSAEVTQFTSEENNGPNGAVFFHLSGNALCEPTRSRSLGWKPKLPAEAVFDQIKDSMKVLLEQEAAKKST
ncbi:hypothetical protein EIP91_011840 [Steccherinum ochraceum]|uniref:Semialdehyde dehydrogenase NAD-binding domain-containing protein n=1 Tax=Steccherinum ochraceum TaxID=92696 RepID=A0A4R0RK57_9APHY|nr:hypothetical protein EIP91_011840 [Steccherinum ochraceum]